MTNPLQTPTILAIQGVARSEREAALKAGGLDKPEFKLGQYLCTGYDCYCLDEPDFYEAMSLLHARVRRVVYVRQNRNGGSLGGSTELKDCIHSLTGTNHHFRVFKANCGLRELVEEELRKSRKIKLARRGST